MEPFETVSLSAVAWLRPAPETTSRSKPNVPCGGDEAVADVEPDRALDAEVGGRREVEAEAAAAVDGEQRPVDRAGDRCLVELHVEVRDVDLHAGDTDEGCIGDREAQTGVRRRRRLDPGQGEVDAGGADAGRARRDGGVRRVEPAADTGPERCARDGDLQGALARDRAAGHDVVLEREVAGRGDEAVRDVDADRPLDAEVGGAGEREPGDAGERRPVQRRRRNPAGCLVHLDVERADVELDARDADERRGRDRELEAGVRREAVLERSEGQTDAARGDPDRAGVDGPVIGRVEAPAEADPELAARKGEEQRRLRAGERLRR